MEVTFQMWESKGDDSELGEQVGDTDIRIQMSFGVVDELPVPILWGGKQMREQECHDLHERKTLTMTPEGKESRYATTTTSWLRACQEIQKYQDNRVLKAIKHLLPSPCRMVNLATGARPTPQMWELHYTQRVGTSFG